MKPENIKCGEIIRYAPGKYTFTCSHCSESFTRKSEALSHFESHFMVESTMKFEVDFDIQEEPEVTSVGDNLVKNDIENWEADIKQEETVEECSENGFLLNEEYCDYESTSVETNTLEPAFPNVVNDHVVRLSLRPQLKWGPTFTRKSLLDCDICGKQMVKINLMKHFLSHLNQKEFICTICERGFNNKNQLKRHTTTHSTTKRYSCDHCGWQFHDHANLIVHIRKHTGEKPYKCNYCNKAFTQASSFKTHIRTHTGDKPYKCTLCSRTFASSSAFRLHEKRHNNHRPYPCKLCENKSFHTLTCLKTHIQTVHSGERPHVCQVCNLSYSRKKHYNQHILLHTGEKKYKCRACDLCFVQSAGRRLHERSAHKDVAHLLINT